MKRIHQNRLDWMLLGLIALVCAGLTLLQYRWTGDISRAERERLRSGLDDQVGRLARTFDDELRQSCRALIPDVAQIREQGLREAHRARYQQWASSHDRTRFDRIAIALPERGTLNLYALDGDGRMVEMQWPSTWAPLRSAMTERMHDTGPPPSVPLNSTLIEFPVFDNSEGPRERNAELDWMIFEVSENDLRTRLLPRLVAEYLESGSHALFDVSASWADSPRSVLFSTRADKLSVAGGADLNQGIFSSDIAGLADRFQRRRGRAGPRTRWILSVRHRAGSLDAAVSRARTRNLATSFVLIGVLGGAAWALVHYTSRARRLAEAQFRFAAGVSHDLRTPLTAIRGAAFNLADGLVTEPGGVKRYANLILRNAEELTSMIENVLAFSAALHSGRDPRRETFAVGDLLEHAATAMAPEVEQAGCRLELQIAPGLPALKGDPIALEHAFRNLIANAARHASQGRWIGVSAARYDEGVEVRVSDRGPGIPDEELGRVFQPFYRGEQTRSSQVRGTGLGLSIVKDTVERHRGTVSVQNSSPSGVQVTVRLPLADESA